MMLKDAILDKIRQHNIELRCIADIACVPPAIISGYLNNTNNLSFEAALKIVKQLFPLQAHEYMVNYALQQSGENARLSLEYTNMNQLRAISEILINKLSFSDDPLDQEWSKVYELEMLRYKKTVPYDELLQKIDQLRSHSLETKILLSFIKSYISYDLRKFQELDKQIDYIDRLIKDIQNQYLQDSFYIRLGLIMNHVCLNRNDLEQARYYCRLIIDRDVTPYLKSSAYLNLGRSYFFDDYLKAKTYLEYAIKGFDLAESPNYTRIAEYNLSFLNSYWKIERKFELNLYSFLEKSQYAYYLIQSGERREAEEVLSCVSEEITEDWQKALHTYYLGYLREDRNLLVQSALLFSALGDYFHINMPINCLRHLGVSDQDLKKWQFKSNEEGA